MEAYVSLVKADGTRNIDMRYDLQENDFLLPPLTLQPIVENAVKHGMDPEIECLTVTVRTRRVNGGSKIIVEDDGADFLAPEDMEEGVGLKSSRIRLERMCGGTLNITPRQGGGAVATLRIPEREG